MSRRVLFSMFLFVLCLMRVAAQVEDVVDADYLAEIDSIMTLYEEQDRMVRVEKTVKEYEATRLKKEMSMGAGGVLPLARGLLLSWTDHHFITQDARFPSKGDGVNWSAYAVGGVPLVANWALRAAGVKSRSKLERMLTANAMALGLSFGATEVLKISTNEGRPDQSNRHSFPSGHASFAFVSASILSREYGYISPWVTVGSYATATGTQLLRINHNKHWMNDLYVGAGIGMISTNLAYFLTDKIFGMDGINKPEVRKKDVLRLLRFNEKPTGISLVSGTEIGDRKIHFSDATLKTGASIAAGADLTWHLKSDVAAEVMVRAVDAQVKVFGQNHTFTGDHLNLYHLNAGAKYSLPINMGNRMGTRAFAGVRIMDGASLTDGKKTYAIPDETKFECGIGLTYECLDSDNYAWGFIADYYHTFSHYMKNRYSISSVWKILF